MVVKALPSHSGASNAILSLVAAQEIVALATPPLFLEYEDLLKRAEHVLVHGLSFQQIDEFLSELAARLEPVGTHFQWRPQVRDPGDEMVLEAAINGQADALLTFNTSHFTPAGKRFGIKILRPGEFLVEFLKEMRR